MLCGWRQQQEGKQEKQSWRSPSSQGFGSCPEGSLTDSRRLHKSKHHASTVSQSQERGCCF
ncbi:rCG34272, isoform CRA_b [Rattus norvegicus]|uniref:RCG34272, isoform CRA_b n=1 Tax=Rattus norvegicus TaxID=10116 RepID=A6HKY3_RAT|nr:rCG34272, isoform CRA_b [Rattus norvegicus]